MTEKFTLEYVDETTNEDVIKEIEFDGSLTDLMDKIVEQWDDVEDLDDFGIMLGTDVTDLPMEVYSGYYSESFGWSMPLRTLSDLSEFFDKAENAYSGNFDSDADFAEDFYRAMYEVPESLEGYIDWEAMGKDYTQDYTVVKHDHSNYYFRIN